MTREEILERIWGKDLFLDTDNAINSAVRKIRHALHDNPDSPRFVVTVPAKGYRFIAKVKMAAADDELPGTLHAGGTAPIVVGREAELA